MKWTRAGGRAVASPSLHLSTFQATAAFVLVVVPPALFLLPLVMDEDDGEVLDKGFASILLLCVRLLFACAALLLGVYSGRPSLMHNNDRTDPLPCKPNPPRQ